MGFNLSDVFTCNFAERLNSITISLADVLLQYTAVCLSQLTPTKQIKSDPI